jgi:hypothetical protein
MDLLTSIIDIESIQLGSNSPDFEIEKKQLEIEALAHAIIQLNGLLKVPVVRVLGIDEYELVSGYLEYYAYLKAQEISPKIADRMTVFILTSKNQKAIEKQLEVYQAIEGSMVNPKVDVPQTDSKLALQLNNLESQVQRLLASIERIQKDSQHWQTELLKAINSKQSTPGPTAPPTLPPLEGFSRLLEPPIEKQVLHNLKCLGEAKATKIVKILKEYLKNNQGEKFIDPNSIRKALGKGILSQQALDKIIYQWE